MSLRKITPFLAALFLVACDDDSSSSAPVNDPDEVVESSSAGETEKVSSSSESKAKSSSNSETEKLSSSEKSKEESSSSETVESSSSEKPASSSSETDALSSSSEDMKDSSSSEAPESSGSEPEPKEMANIEVRAFQYIFSDLDFLRLTVANNEDHDLDSLEIRLFFTAKPEQVENCATLIDHDLCQMFDKDGSDSLCKNDREIRDLMRRAHAIRYDNSSDSTHTYYYPINLGSTTIKPQEKLSMDVSFSSGISSDHFMTCETLRMPAKKRFSKDSGDWSWMPHTLAEDGADYAGMLFETQEYGSAGGVIPLNPYIAVYRKDGYLWGYAPLTK